MSIYSLCISLHVCVLAYDIHSIDNNMALRLSVSAYTHTFTFLQLLM